MATLLRSVSRRADLEADQALVQFAALRADDVSLLEEDAYSRGIDERDFRRPLGERLDAQKAYALLQRSAVQRIKQSSVSFWASIYAGAIGFLTLIGGAIVAIWTRDAVASGIPVLAGVVLDAAAILFHAQDAKTQTAVTENFRRLQRERAIDEALKLTDAVKVPAIQASLQAALALQLVRMTGLEQVHARVTNSLNAPREPGEESTEQADPGAQEAPGASAS